MKVRSSGHIHTTLIGAQHDWTVVRIKEMKMAGCSLSVWSLYVFPVSLLPGFLPQSKYMQVRPGNCKVACSDECECVYLSMYPVVDWGSVQYILFLIFVFFFVNSKYNFS